MLKTKTKTNPIILWQKCAAMQHTRCFVVSLRISSYYTADSRLYLQFHRLLHKEHNNLLSTAAGVVGRSHRGRTDNVSVNI